MKKSILLALIVAFTSCASKKNGDLDSYTITSPCPTEGACTFELLKDKSLDIKTDGIGSIYYQIIDNPGKAVGIYTYKKHNNPDYQDDFYDEEIVFETDNDMASLKDGSAKSKQLMFTVRCFCRGKAGTYRAEKGTVNFSNNKLVIQLNDIVEDQKTKNIEVVFK